VARVGRGRSAKRVVGLPTTKEETMDKFWMVFLEGGSSPRHKHESFEDALAEAERLTAKQHQTAYILQSVGKVNIAIPPTVYEEIL